MFICQHLTSFRHSFLPPHKLQLQLRPQLHFSPQKAQFIVTKTTSSSNQSLPPSLSLTHTPDKNATASNKNTRLSSTSASYISLEANQVPSTMNRPSAAFSPPSGPVPHTQRYNHTSPHNSHRRGYCRPKCAPRSTRPWRRLLWYCS